MLNFADSAREDVTAVGVAVRKTQAAESLSVALVEPGVQGEELTGAMK